MRILHASHTHLKSLGARNYFLPVRINNGFVREGHEVFWFSERDVARYSAPIPSRKLGKRAANRKFLEVCRNFQPDVIALCSQNMIHSETLAQARRLLPNAAAFQYYIDPLFDANNLRNVVAKAEVVDFSFVTTGGAILEKIAGSVSKAAFVPNPVDASIDVHRNHEQTNLDYDVFFAGRISKWQDADDLRAQAPRLVAEQLPQARCAFYGFDNNPGLFGADFMRTLGQVKIGLNFSQRTLQARSGSGGELYLYSSDRIGLYQGNGLLVFSTRAFQLSELYGEEAIVEVDSAEEFIDKLRYYLEHDSERQRIARIGYELGHREFNERLVVRYLLESVLGLPASHDYRWPTEHYGHS